MTTTTGTSCPTLREKCVGSLTSPASHISLKMQETGPTVYMHSPYPRRLERISVVTIATNARCVKYEFLVSVMSTIRSLCIILWVYFKCSLSVAQASGKNLSVRPVIQSRALSKIVAEPNSKHSATRD